MKLLDNKNCGPHDGRSLEPEYLSWVRMQRRCYEPKYKGYKDYGGRGITVCEAWLKDYRAFIADMGRKPSPKHSLDRKDNNGNYEPGNCRWVTKETQNRNRRSTRQITFNGETKCISHWAKDLGIHRHALDKRLATMPLEKALKTSAAIPADVRTSR